MANGQVRPRSAQIVASGDAMLLDRMKFSLIRDDADLAWENPSEVPGLSTQVHLWRLDFPAVDNSEINAIASVLSDDERERAERFHFDIHRNRFVVGRSGLRVLLATYLAMPPSEIRFQYGAFGKPRLASSALQFNLTHSHDLCLIAISRKRSLGIDIEHETPGMLVPQLAVSAFGMEEADRLARLPEAEQARTFLRLWTRREAIGKCIGVGLSAEPTQRREECEIQFFSPASRYVGCLATADETRP